MQILWKNKGYILFDKITEILTKKFLRVTITGCVVVAVQIKERKRERESELARLETSAMQCALTD